MRRADEPRLSRSAGSRTTEAPLCAERAARPGASFLTCRTPPDRMLPGCVGLEPFAHDVWYPGSLAVDPLRQGAGHGRALLAAAEMGVRARGGRRIRMTVVNVRDALIAWYARHGYRPTGETEPFPYGDDRFGVPQRRDLAFAVLEKPPA